MGTRTCLFARETETERAVETSILGVGRRGSGSGSSSAVSVVSMVSSGSVNGIRVESAGDTADLGPVEADNGDMIRSILLCVGFNAEGELPDLLGDSLSFANAFGRSSVSTLRRGRAEASVLRWLDVFLG